MQNLPELSSECQSEVQNLAELRSESARVKFRICQSEVQKLAELSTESARVQFRLTELSSESAKIRF